MTTRLLLAGIALAIALPVHAQTVNPIVESAPAGSTPNVPIVTAPLPVDAPRPITVDLIGGHGWLTNNQPAANAVNLRAVYDLPYGDTVRAEVLDETKFGSHGGVVGGSYTAVLGTDWLLTGTLAFGHGGLNWAKVRTDVEVGKKWLEAKNLVTRIAAYRAVYDGDRSDTGGRVSVAYYTDNHFVFEAGGLYNVSQPSSVSSQQGFASVTWGLPGRQYLSARFSSGTEAYQAIGDGRQLVGFHSKSYGLGWRQWIDRSWGLSLGAEYYRNPSYARTTALLGAFVQW